MSRSKRFLYNSLSAAGLQIVTFIVGFIIPRLMMQVYGSEINGLVTSVTQFVAYFTLVEAGLASAAVVSLYKPLAEKDNCAINGILSAARHFYNQAGHVFVILVIGLAFVYPCLTSSTAVSAVEMGILVMVTGVSGALDFYAMAKYRVLLTADQRVYVLSIASICSILMNLLIIAVLAYYRINIVIVKSVALSSILLRSFILYIYVKQKYENINFQAEPNYRALNKRWDAFYLQILGSVHTGAPIIIATIFTSLKSVSVYSVYNLVMGGVSGILSAAINGLFASFGDVIARQEQEILQKAYQEFELTYYMLISWVYSCSLILIMPFIKLYTQGITDANYYVPALGTLFVINGLLYNIKTPQGMLVISAGLFKETKIQTTIQGLIAVVGGLILVQYWGLAGILVGAIVSNIYRDVDLLFFIPRNVTKLPVRTSLYRILRVFLCVLIVQLPFIYYKIHSNTYLEWARHGFMISLYSFVVIFVINAIFDGNILKRVLKRIMTTFRRSGARDL